MYEVSSIEKLNIRTKRKKLNGRQKSMLSTLKARRHQKSKKIFLNFSGNRRKMAKSIQISEFKLPHQEKKSLKTTREKKFLPQSKSQVFKPKNRISKRKKTKKISSFDPSSMYKRTQEWWKEKEIKKFDAQRKKYEKYEPDTISIASESERLSLNQKNKEIHSPTKGSLQVKKIKRKIQEKWENRKKNLKKELNDVFKGIKFKEKKRNVRKRKRDLKKRGHFGTISAKNIKDPKLMSKRMIRECCYLKNPRKKKFKKSQKNKNIEKNSLAEIDEKAHDSKSEYYKKLCEGLDMEIPKKVGIREKMIKEKKLKGFSTSRKKRFKDRGKIFKNIIEIGNFEKIQKLVPELKEVLRKPKVKKLNRDQERRFYGLRNCTTNHKKILLEETVV